MSKPGHRAMGVGLRITSEAASAPAPAPAPLSVPGRGTAADHERRSNTPVRNRILLQRRAAANLRRHVRRAVIRFTVLLLADLTAFVVMRGVLRGVRDFEILGSWVADQAALVLPRGLLIGWQFGVALILALLVTGNYGPADERRSPHRLFLAAALATALPLWSTVWTRGLAPVGVQYLVVTMFVWAALVFERLLLNRLVEPVLHRLYRGMRTLLVGSGEQCRLALATPLFALAREYTPIGFVDAETPANPASLGPVGEFARVLRMTNAEAVLIAGRLPADQFQEVVDASLAAGCEVLSVPSSIDGAGAHPATVWRHGQALVELSRPTLKGRQLLLKRLLDVVGSLLGLIVLAPVFALIALAVKLETRGPVIFRQHRIGQNGRRFPCLKFRSMHEDAEEMLRLDQTLYAEYVANNFKLSDARDPRRTRVGRFLRKTSLDELPQLLNVLRGDMSLVGPRPIVPEELEQYGPGGAILLSLKPGITGAWAVNGRSRVGYPDRADIELEYVKSWSLGLDLLILLRTLPTVLRGQGAH